jgi:hypothetical protein
MPVLELNQLVVSERFNGVTIAYTHCVIQEPDKGKRGCKLVRFPREA